MSTKKHTLSICQCFLEILLSNHIFNWYYANIPKDTPKAPHINERGTRKFRFLKKRNFLLEKNSLHLSKNFMNNPQRSLIIAGICYTIPFINPSHLWWLIFLFPVFLFKALYHAKIRLIPLFVWSFIVSGIHLLPLADAIISMTSAPLMFQVLPTALSIFYGAFYPYTFLVCSQSAMRLVSSMYGKLCIFTLALWAYLLSMEYLLFWVFGRVEGYTFSNPLLPLISLPTLLAALHWIGMPWMLLWYSISTAPIILFIKHRSTTSLGVLLITALFWILPASIAPSYLSPTWLKQVGHLPIMIPETMSAERGAMLIAHEIALLHVKHPGLQLVVMPESAWNGSALTSIPYLLALSKIAVPHVIIGSFAGENDRYYNSLYWFLSGTQMDRFDKRHAVPYTERIPYGGRHLCNRLFFEKSPPLTTSTKPHIPIRITNTWHLVPYICSELFCNNSPYDPESTCPILATCNDWWFSMKWFQKLMLMTAQLRALQWNRPILYIAFHHAYYIDPAGIKHAIATTYQDHS